MDDPQATHPVEDPSGPQTGRLLVLVPPRLPSHVGYFTSMLAGSGIEVIIERRRAERRRRGATHAEDRRRGDRRGPHGLVGHLYGCQIVRVGRSGDAPAPPRRRAG